MDNHYLSTALPLFLSQMQRLYETVFQVLGRRVDSRQYRRLLDVLQEKPLLDTGLYGSDSKYIFHGSGINLFLLPLNLQFGMAEFVIRPGPYEEHPLDTMIPYVRDLPFRILPSDLRPEVEHKVGQQPAKSRLNRSGNYWLLSYEEQPLTYNFLFDPKTDQLCYVSVAIVSALSPLFRCILNDDLAGVKKELVTGEDPNLIDPIERTSSLEAAIWRGHVSIVEELLKAGANPSLIRVGQVQRAILGAPKEKREDFAALLEAAGAKNVRDTRGILFEYILDFLGQEVDRWPYTNLVPLLGEPLVRDYERNRQSWLNKRYEFSNYGIVLSTSPDGRWLLAEIDPSRCRVVGDLPNQIHHSDSRELVQRKMSEKPVLSHSLKDPDFPATWLDVYNMTPCLLNFYFDSTNHLLFLRVYAEAGLSQIRLPNVD